MRVENGKAHLSGKSFKFREYNITFKYLLLTLAVQDMKPVHISSLPLYSIIDLLRYTTVSQLQAINSFQKKKPEFTFTQTITVELHKETFLLTSHIRSWQSVRHRTQGLGLKGFRWWWCWWGLLHNNTGGIVGTCWRWRAHFDTPADEERG